MPERGWGSRRCSLMRWSDTFVCAESRAPEMATTHHGCTGGAAQRDRADYSRDALARRRGAVLVASWHPADIWGVWRHRARCRHGHPGPTAVLGGLGRPRVRRRSRGLLRNSDQKVVRSSNNPVADYSEYLTARAFGLTLVANANIGFDAIGPDDVRYQVKARRLTAHNKSRQLGFLRGLDKVEAPFDLLVGILFNADFTVLRASLIPFEVIRDSVARVDYVNGWRFILREAVWDLPGVEDATDSIRAAVHAPVAAPAVVQVKVAKSPVVHGADPAWTSALERYGRARTLRTRARGRPFTVGTGTDHLLITPQTGRPRRVFAAEFLRVTPILESASRQELLAVTFNASYLEAIVDDLRASEQAGRLRG